VLHCMAVSEQAREQGLDLAVWSQLKTDYPSLWWVAEPAGSNVAATFAA